MVDRRELKLTFNPREVISEDLFVQTVQRTEAIEEDITPSRRSLKILFSCFQ